MDGTNNFFWGNYNSTTGRYDFPLSTDPNLFGGVYVWQGVTFSGLNAGTYTFTCGTTCGTTQQWASLNGAGDTITLMLQAGDIGGGGTTPVPEPMSMALFGMGLLGLGMVRRRA